MYRRRVLSVVFVTAVLLWLAQPISGQVAQSPARLLDEAQTVYLGNLARRDNGVPPLCWNKQLTDAARWFSWDSDEQPRSPRQFTRSEFARNRPGILSAYERRAWLRSTGLRE